MMYIYTSSAIYDTKLKRRKILDVTQETLAEISGVGLRTLKQLESGKGNPTLETLQKICDALGLEIKLEIKNIK
ncbi:helix-turn-helix domain-containing protein [Chryseobacterium sp. MDT2-18]|uniref:helix-turn-helix domain-containing protein n=1 Tax=Chryseobacterium sp. MDT2-18 TaxID=1259136 RepID=UPI00278B5258|nr:helix-turn-helix domain-containing protein [Chryseobacterium sp. MDT2-18]MDQ0477309.1 transcriptional regulator with XRE-family HTH domain [Chryseobacterium sp. MDT2-18]